MATTNLPLKTSTDQDTATRLFFDSYGQTPIEFNAVDVDAAVGFFTGKGFDQDAAIVVAAAILKQARLDSRPVFEILDTLKGFNTVELSILVGEILNNNRVPTSTLGFRTTQVRPNQTRNIVA